MQKRSADQKKRFAVVIKALGIDKAVKKFGEKDVKWAVGKYLTGIRDRSRLLRQKADAEAKMKEINDKLGI